MTAYGRRVADVSGLALAGLWSLGFQGLASELTAEISDLNFRILGLFADGARS